MSAGLAVFLASVAQATVTPATTDRDRAQLLLDQGAALFERGDSAGALERFEAAYAAYPSPKLWFDIGQANRDLRRPVQAAEAFEKFLAGVPDQAGAARAEALAALTELAPILGRLHIRGANDGVAIELDGRPVGTMPMPGLLWTIPGRHVVAARAPSGRLSVAAIDVAAGEIQLVWLPRPTASAPPMSLDAAPVAPSAPRPGWLGRKWTWVATGGAVLLAGGATVSGLLMQSKFDDLKRSCGATAAGCSASQMDSLNLRRDTANLLWVAAGAAALSAGVLFFVEGHPVAVHPLAGATAGLQARTPF